MSKTAWSVSDISQEVKMHSNDLEFQDRRGEWHHFTVIATPTRVVFGGVCNTGFIESGYIEREVHESLDETLQEMLADLQVFYDDGANYTSRIVYNQRM